MDEEEYWHRCRVVDVSFADEKHGWASGDGGFIISTKNGGTTWAQQTIDTNNTIEGIHFVSPQVGWAAGGGRNPFSTPVMVDRIGCSRRVQRSTHWMLFSC